MQIINDLKLIHHENFQIDGDLFDSQINDLLMSYGYISDKDIPDWFHHFVSMIVSHTLGTFLFDSVGSEIGSFFQDLKQDYNWSLIDHGEEIDFVLPAYALRVVISREAIDADNRGCVSCAISEIKTSESST